MFDEMNVSTLTHMGLVTLNGTAAVASSLVDVQGYNALDIAVTTGVITVAGVGGWAIKMQHSDTTVAGSFEDVTAADAINGTVSIARTLDTDDNIIVGRLGYVGSRRYVRLLATGTTNSAGIVLPIAREARSGVTRPNTLITAATAAT